MLKSYLLISIVLILAISLVSSEIFPSQVNVVDIGRQGDSGQTGVNIFIPEPQLNTSTISTNHSTFADTAITALNWFTDDGGLLGDVADILHSDLSNLLWSVAGHIIDTDLDMDGNDIDNVGNIQGDGVDSYFNQTLLISGDTPVSEDSDASLWLRAEVNYDACVNLTESTIAGISICYDGSGSGIFEIRNYKDGTLYMTIDSRDSGNITFYNDTIFETILVTTMNITGDLTGYAANLSFIYGALGIGGIDMRADPWYFSGADFQIVEDLIVDGNTTSNYFIGNGSHITDVCLSNGTNCVASGIDSQKNTTGNFLYNDTSTIYFNETKLATTYYNATQSLAVTGTIDGGSLVDTQHPDGDYDGVTFNFSEAAGSPGLDLRMNFTNVEDFNKGYIRYKTSSLSGDSPAIQLWDYDSLEWEGGYGFISETEQFLQYTNDVLDSSSHIQDDVIQMRLYKGVNGNTQNHYYVDMVAVVDGYATPSGNVDLSPYAKLNDSEQNITANYIFTNGSHITDVCLSNGTNCVAGGGGTDTWELNYTYYYNKSEVDDNFSLYGPLAENNNWTGINNFSNNVTFSGDHINYTDMSGAKNNLKNFVTYSNLTCCGTWLGSDNVSSGILGRTDGSLIHLFIGENTGSSINSYAIAGENYPSILYKGDQINFGRGAATPDTALYSDTANELRTGAGDSFLAGGGYKSGDGSVGLTTIITTSKLTGGGFAGSMTFKNGILTASTPAT